MWPLTYDLIKFKLVIIYIYKYLLYLFSAPTLILQSPYHPSLGEVAAALFMSTRPPWTYGTPHWGAREAGPAGRCSRAGGAAGQVGQSSRPACLVVREAGPTENNL